MVERFPSSGTKKVKTNLCKPPTAAGRFGPVPCPAAVGVWSNSHKGFTGALQPLHAVGAVKSVRYVRSGTYRKARRKGSLTGTSPEVARQSSPHRSTVTNGTQVPT